MPTILPFISLPDPEVSGEGAIDPLGLAGIGNRLADQVLPGLRARMSRVRFLTAMAVSAAVCEGLEDEISVDGVTTAEIVFEWVLVEGFARGEPREAFLRTPGIDKARRAKEAKVPMRAGAYLRAPTVFGFHGIYKPAARHLGIVDDELRLAEHGYELLDIWEREQGLSGFVHRSGSQKLDSALPIGLRTAVGQGLAAGYTARSGGWQGWAFFPEHLAPAEMGRGEAQFLRKLLLDERGDTRGEVFELLNVPGDHARGVENEIVSTCLWPKASPRLRTCLNHIRMYERFCSLVEGPFDWLRFVSASAGARAVGPDEFASGGKIRKIASALPKQLAMTESALAEAPIAIQEEFGELATAFQDCEAPARLYAALLSRHADVQRRKPPDGKRGWFEHAADGRVMVRPPYRPESAPAFDDRWRRPYRFTTVGAFTADLRRALHG